MVTYLSSLVQLCCGQGRILQTDISGMCRECSKSGPHVVFPHSGHVFSWSTLLSLQLALQGNCLKWALGCVHFPGVSCSGSGSQVLHKGTDSVGPAFCALPSSGDQVLGEHSLPQIGGASYRLP